MLKPKSAFSSFSVDDLASAKKFYTETLKLKIDSERMGLTLSLPKGGGLFLYEKKNHKPATFTVLNLIVGDIDKAVDELVSKGVRFEHYTGEIATDKKGIARSNGAKSGPNIAWFKDPAGNILSVIESK